jgi:hypothetical protein
MLKKVFAVLKNQQGMQTIEALGLGLLSLVVVALLYNAVQAPMSTTATKIGTDVTGLGAINTTTATLSL